MDTHSTPWQRYSVDRFNLNPDGEGAACRKLDTVAYVTHVFKARRLLSTGPIPTERFRFLKTSIDRLVVRVSPNDWTNAGGDYHGSVRFNYSFEDLAHKKNAYWIEDDWRKEAEKTSRARILLSSSEYPQFTPYDPVAHSGPWLFDKKSNSHFWNGQINLEFFIDEPLMANECSSIDFIRHHPKYCMAKNGVPCSEVNSNAGEMFVCSLLSLNSKCRRKITGKISGLDSIVKALIGSFMSQNCKGSHLRGTPGATELVKFALLAHSQNRASHVADLCSLFQTPLELGRVVSKVLNDQLQKF